MLPFSRVPLRRPSPRHAIVAGGLASVAYLIEQAIDRRLIPNDYDDLVLWGGFLTRRPWLQRVLGLGVHFTLGTALAAAYDAAGDALPRVHPAVRGVLFAQGENAVLYPGVPVMNAIHPAVRHGELPSLLTWRYFLVELLRHAAYGAVLGVVSERLEDER
jgi:hypothetical protein